MSWPERVELIMQQSHCDSKDFKEWLLTKGELNKEHGSYFFHSILWHRCFEIQKSVLKHNQDHFIVVTGGEGSGKSTLSKQVGGVLDPTFSEKNLIHTKEMFIDAVRYFKPGQVLWLDEGILFLFSREAIGKDNREMVKLLTLMRQKNLIIIICIPRFKDIESKIREQRVDTYIHVSKSEHKRNYICYNKEAAQAISECMKRGALHKLKLTTNMYFRGSFNRWTPDINNFDWEKYEKSKRENFDNYLTGLSHTERELDADYIPISKAKGILDVSNHSYKRMIQDGTLKGKKIRGLWMVNTKSLKELPELNDMERD